MVNALMVRTSKISIREAYARLRLGGDKSCLAGFLFQSTKPTQGFDQPYLTRYSNMLISIHEAYARLRLTRKTWMDAIVIFQSTKPTQGFDRSQPGFIGQYYQFQSTKPTQGFDKHYQKKILPSKISIHEAYARLRQCMRKCIDKVRYFNPRSLRKASTLVMEKLLTKLEISIHEAYARLRLWTVHIRLSRDGFQSTKPTQGFDHNSIYHTIVP